MSDFGFGFGGDPGLDPTGIDAWLTGEIAAILSALSYIWAALVAAANWLLNAVIALAKFIAAHILIAAKAIAHLAEDLYQNIIKPIIDEIVKIEKFLAQVFAPIIRLLKRIQAWYNKYILPYQKLALEIISRLRVAISLFKLLGFKWAQKLDAEFAKIQSYITTSILDVVTTLNTVVTWLGFVTDPLGIIRKQFWQTTVFSGLGDLHKAGNVGSMRPITSAETQEQQQNKALLDPKVPPITLDASGNAVFTTQMQSIADNMNAASKLYNPTVAGYTGPQAG
jgi:hypothetical protein